MRGTRPIKRVEVKTLLAPLLDEAQSMKISEDVKFCVLEAPGPNFLAVVAVRKLPPRGPRNEAQTFDDLLTNFRCFGERVELRATHLRPELLPLNRPVLDGINEPTVSVDIDTKFVSPGSQKSHVGLAIRLGKYARQFEVLGVASR
jgi:hypothetical protein